MSQARRALVVLMSVIAMVLGFAPAAFAQSSGAVTAKGVAPKSPAPSASSVHATAARPGPGYWLASKAGGIFSGGDAAFHGSPGAIATDKPIVGIAATPSGHGYWLVASDGGIFAFGDAAFHGSTGSIALNKPIVGMASTPTGKGYWLVASDGGIFSFGDATFHGSTGAMTLNQPIVGMASSRSGMGYNLVASDGGLFSFGDATFHGSTGAIALKQPIVGMAGTRSGRGYWLVAADGGIFAFGDAVFHGSTGALALNQPIVGMTSTASGKGYWFVAADGGVFSFGDAAFLGSAATAASLGGDVVGIARSQPIAAAPKPPTPPAPAAKQLTFTTQPASVATGGTAFATQPVVTVQDASGHTVPTDTSAVTLTITGATQSVLTCTADPKSAVAGVATFAGCNIDVQGSYTITATDGALTSDVSTGVIVTVGPSARISFLQQPSGAASLVNFASQAHVATTDLGGNVVTTNSTGTVTLSLQTPVVPAGAVLGCTSLTATYLNGVATFAGCHIDLSGTYHLHAVDAAANANSAAINITAAGATHLAFTTQPASATGGAAFGSQPVVKVEDASGNTVIGDASSVTLTITTPAGATLACTTNPKPAVAGVATFAGCNIDHIGTYTLHAADAALTAVDSAAITITVGTAAKLAFTAQPTSQTGGVAFGTQPSVTVQDLGGNTVTSNVSPVTLSLTTPAGATLACTTNPATAAAGVATFAGCNIDRPGTYTVGAVDGALTAANSDPVTITVGPATQLAFTRQPTSQTGGVAFATQPAVTVRDAGGNTVTTDATSVTLSLNAPGSATLACTSANPLPTVNGVASFTGCNVDVAGIYTLHAVDGGLVAAGASSPITITVGAAAKLGFVQQPTSQTGGVAFATQPHVAIQDAGGNTVTTDTSPVTLSITTPGSATLACTNASPLPAVAGVASFTACNIDLVGTYTLHATDGALTIAQSASLTITLGPAARVAFVQQPSGAASVVPFATQPHVASEDAGGNVITTRQTGTVTLSLAVPAGATLACTSLTATYVNGVASFTGCNIDVSGTYNLHADDTAFNVNSTGVSITIAASAKLVFSTQPTGATSSAAFGTQPVVTIQDAGNNTVTADASSVTLTLTTPGSATLLCTPNPQSAVDGVATFTGCNIDVVGTYTLHAADAALTIATSTAITITVGTAAKLGFVQQPSGGTGGTALGSQPHVAIQDAAGNTVAANTSTVTLSITTPAGATLACTSANPLAAVAGVASFAGCNIDHVGTYTFAAADAALTSATSAPLTISFGAANKLVFVQQPSDQTGGNAFTTQPQVAVQDAGGNTVTNNVSNVTLTLNAPGGATLACTSANPLAAVAGVASFTGCNIDHVGTYTLHAADAALNVADSAAVTITVGPGTNYAFTTQPSSQTGGVAFGTQPVVTIHDNGGNVATADTSAVTLSITTPAGATLACTNNTPNAAAGVATFAGCKINKANDYTLTATSGVGPAAQSSPITISVGLAAKLGFVQQPTSQTGGIAFATQPQVAVQDAGGNTVTTDVSSVTLTLTTPAGATLICTGGDPVTAATGVASFTGCNINRANATPYTLHAARAGLVAATSAPVTITVGPAAQVVFTIQPSANNDEGVTFATQPQGTVEDAGGNVLTADNTSSVTIDLTRPSDPVESVLSCDATTVVVTAGVATFVGCSVDIASTSTYTIHAIDTTDDVDGTSAEFTVVSAG